MKQNSWRPEPRTVRAGDGRRLAENPRLTKSSPRCVAAPQRVREPAREAARRGARPRGRRQSARTARCTRRLQRRPRRRRRRAARRCDAAPRATRGCPPPPQPTPPWVRRWRGGARWLARARRNLAVRGAAAHPSRAAARPTRRSDAARRRRRGAATRGAATRRAARRGWQRGAGLAAA